MYWEHLQQSAVGENHLTQSPFYSKVLSIFCHSFIENWTASEKQTWWVMKHNVKKCWWHSISIMYKFVYPQDHEADWESALLWLPSIRREYMHTHSPRKDHSSKFEVGFYSICILFTQLHIWKFLKLNHHKLGTSYIIHFNKIIYFNYIIPQK